MLWMSTTMRTISPAVLLLSSADGWLPKTLKMKLVRTVFDSSRDSAIDALGLSVANQRLDSTHSISNIRGRLALFSNTLGLFLKSLDEDHFSRVPAAIQEWHATEPEGWFGLGPAEQKVKLEELVQ
jgi:hypothetical protein